MEGHTLRNKGASETIYYASVSSTLGQTLVARTERGLCAVSFGDDQEDLVAELSRRYPQATLHVAVEDLAADLEDLHKRLSEPTHVWPLPPLHLAGTLFEQRVWAAMTDIPVGQTCEYGRFAAALGMPNGQRAIGAAVGKNPLALLYPCHRVVARGGGLHRYRWGLDRKRWLLEREGALVPALPPLQAELALAD